MHTIKKGNGQQATSIITDELCPCCGEPMVYEKDGFSHEFGYQDTSGLYCDNNDCESNQLPGAA